MGDPKIYLDERGSFDKLYSKIHKHFTERNKLFKPIFDKALANNLTRQDIKKIQDKDWELVTILEDNNKIGEYKSSLHGIIDGIFIVFISGGIFLLLSFLIP